MDQAVLSQPLDRRDVISSSGGRRRGTISTYGHYGGGHYSENKEYDRILLTKPDGSPLSHAQLLAQGSSDQDPVDKLDSCFTGTTF